MEAAARKAFGQHHSHESELRLWDSPLHNWRSSTSPRGSAARSRPTSTPCSADAKLRHPRDPRAARSGLLPRPGHQRRPPSRHCQDPRQPRANEGEDGIYKISLDRREPTSRVPERLDVLAFRRLTAAAIPIWRLCCGRSSSPKPAGRPSSAIPMRHTTTCRKAKKNPSRTFGWSTVRSARSTT